MPMPRGQPYSISLLKEVMPIFSICSMMASFSPARKYALMAGILRERPKARRIVIAPMNLPS